MVALLISGIHSLGDTLLPRVHTTSQQARGNLKIDRVMIHAHTFLHALRIGRTRPIDVLRSRGPHPLVANSGTGIMSRDIVWQEFLAHVKKSMLLVSNSGQQPNIAERWCGPRGGKGRAGAAKIFSVRRFLD